uniref:Cytochrome P450 n=1 Tax=Musca domestica TaxID=7370 RepID=A0A1I8MHK6_MUSDO
MHLFLIVVIFCPIFLWLLHRWNDRKVISLATKVPSYKLQMLLGFGPITTQKSIISESITGHQKLGRNMLMYMGPFPCYFTIDPVIIKDILNSKLCRDKSDLTYTGVINALGKGLITMKGSEWIPHRKLLNPPFKVSNQITFLPIFNQKVNGLFAAMDQCGYMENSRDILKFCREFTLNITFETMLGHNARAKNIDTKHIAKLVTHITEYISEITFKFFYFNPLVLNLAHRTIFRECRETIEYVKGEIDKILKSFSTGQHDAGYLENLYTAIHCLYESLENNETPREIIISGMIHLFSGAFETTSSSIYFTVLMLAMHPEVQSKLFSEICERFPENDDGNMEVTYEHLSQLPYLDMVLKETLRLFPVVPQIARQVSGGNVRLSNGVVLPEGLNVMLNIFLLHRDPQIWGPKANTFNPDNFLPCNVEQRHPYTYMPFSKGTRTCIGMRYAEMSLKVTMAKIIKRYKFSTTAKIEDFEWENHISLHLVNNPPLTVERR